MSVRAFVVTEPQGPLKPFDFELVPLGPDDVEIKVAYCGICHSDLSVINNEWGNAQFPLVAGHEVIGTITNLGDHVRHLKVGQVVGLGWFSGSCQTCYQCLSGNHNLCPQAEQTIIGRFGGFAERVRCKAIWAVPLPGGLDEAKAGPLFCGGITVFNPLVQFNVKPTDRVAVIGIGGLGHMALQFFRNWGCDVTAFTSSDNKREEALQLGAHHVVNSRNAADLRKHASTFDFILSTVNVPLDWVEFLNTLTPKGRLHFVGVVTEPLALPVFPLISKQNAIGGTPLGSPATVMQMLEFCERHRIEPVTELFPMSQINEAFAHLKSGQARYRIVLQNDWA